MFRCICQRGYKPDATRTKCDDFNECSRVIIFLTAFPEAEDTLLTT